LFCCVVGILPVGLFFQSLVLYANSPFSLYSVSSGCNTC
jgi:hypothetical protein